MLCLHFHSDRQNWPKAQLNLQYSIIHVLKDVSNPNGERQAALKFSYDTQLEDLLGADFAIMELYIEGREGNKQRLEDGIRMTELPKTFQQAIDVATRFKVSYLWIDSLCIIQDSADNWNKVAVLMINVYQHASCKIAATGATDSTQGLFSPRNTSTFQPYRIAILSANENKMKTIIIKDLNLWTNNVENAPLIKRAWVVQERSLARRVLHFSQQQIFGECREKPPCEYYPEGFPHHMITNFKHVDLNEDLPHLGSKYDELSGTGWERI